MCIWFYEHFFPSGERSPSSEDHTPSRPAPPCWSSVIAAGSHGNHWSYKTLSTCSTFARGAGPRPRILSPGILWVTYSVCMYVVRAIWLDSTRSKMFRCWTFRYKVQHCAVAGINIEIMRLQVVTCKFSSVFRQHQGEVVRWERGVGERKREGEGWGEVSRQWVVS